MQGINKISLIMLLTIKMALSSLVAMCQSAMLNNVTCCLEHNFCQMLCIHFCKMVYRTRDGHLTVGQSVTVRQTLVNSIQKPDMCMELGHMSLNQTKTRAFRCYSHLTSKRLFMFMLKTCMRRLAAAVTKSIAGGSSWK